ncbi:FecR domain-containing protein [Pseudomonas syringae]|nr:FecR domain-containing protein [Pseudomonas syringae]MBD8574455.1 FecR domain-containing protein [Pseudomonas syringae]MBD8789016.1 FecR domain-containing protein [Pseudomonas syringae]MBD8800540.1 FecR domain-containing protein [Pseudomonas syringae]MBD8812458.1 FecR domain-containing protein [Pseudomonas syringae]
MSPSGPEREAIRVAAHWYARLASGEDSEHDRQAWQRWHDADPLHRQAWQRVESVSLQFARVPGQVAAPVLRGGQSRRQVLRSVVLLAAAGGLGIAGWRSDTGAALLAQYRTAVGEQRDLQLADGSVIKLNTDTALDVDFNARQRQLTLRAGEILVNASSDSLGRPLWVQTPYGRVQAQDTRLTVRVLGHGAQVSVLRNSAEVHLPDSGPAQSLQAGQQVQFDREHIEAVRPNTPATAAWQHGSLLAIEQPLGELLAELSRYRRGWLRCDPAVAGLKVSGAFPLANTDIALAALESGLGLKVVRHTALWVTVSRA